MSDQTLIPIGMMENSADVAEVFSLLDQVARKLREIQRMTISELNLTPSQFQTLRFLWDHDNQPLKDLAALNGCTRPTMTGIVDTLEKNGLVVRNPHPEDRRSLLIALTPTGKALEGSTPNLEKMYAHCCVGLSAIEFQQLAVLLEKLDQSIDCSCI